MSLVCACCIYLSHASYFSPLPFPSPLSSIFLLPSTDPPFFYPFSLSAPPSPFCCNRRKHQSFLCHHDKTKVACSKGSLFGLWFQEPKSLPWWGAQQHTGVEAGVESGAEAENSHLKKLVNHKEFYFMVILWFIVILLYIKTISNLYINAVISLLIFTERISSWLNI